MRFKACIESLRQAVCACWGGYDEADDLEYDCESEHIEKDDDLSFFDIVPEQFKKARTCTEETQEAANDDTAQERSEQTGLLGMGAPVSTAAASDASAAESAEDGSVPFLNGDLLLEAQDERTLAWDIQRFSLPDGLQAGSATRDEVRTLIVRMVRSACHSTGLAYMQGMLSAAARFLGSYGKDQGLQRFIAVLSLGNPLIGDEDGAELRKAASAVLAAVGKEGERWLAQQSTIKEFQADAEAARRAAGGGSEEYFKARSDYLDSVWSSLLRPCLQTMFAPQFSAAAHQEVMALLKTAPFEGEGAAGLLYVVVAAVKVAVAKNAERDLGSPNDMLKIVFAGIDSAEQLKKALPPRLFLVLVRLARHAAALVGVRCHFQGLNAPPRNGQREREMRFCDSKER